MAPSVAELFLVRLYKPNELDQIDQIDRTSVSFLTKETGPKPGGRIVALRSEHIPSRFLDEERLSKQASSSGTPGPDFEAKVAKLVELGFGREAVIQALKLFDGNEDQAAGFLFGG
ncbi:hypothetical protein SO802_014168 [Lithocarpus litseifolius]|uniref:UBA domain-containing protein n=1 Tax=Lithocarpus litseifolius TaxID=425828 RepID=A0AAW2CQN1_9ROSI